MKQFSLRPQVNTYYNQMCSLHTRLLTLDSKWRNGLENKTEKLFLGPRAKLNSQSKICKIAATTKLLVGPV